MQRPRHFYQQQQCAVMRARAQHIGSSHAVRVSSSMCSGCSRAGVPTQHCPSRRQRWAWGAHAPSASAGPARSPRRPPARRAPRPAPPRPARPATGESAIMPGLAYVHSEEAGPASCHVQNPYISRSWACFLPCPESIHPAEAGPASCHVPNPNTMQRQALLPYMS